MFRGIPATVLALGAVSFLTDLSSEMIYPLLPLFLSGTLAAGAMALGTIEGAAESAAALLKIVSGAISDRLHCRKPLILSGYTLAGAVRPLIGFAASWPMVLGLRLADRFGKGLRTSPRDALIADVTAPARRGTAFGFHRAMDHAGAMAGPLLAAALLSLGGFSLRAVFWAAAVPAAATVIILLLAVREPQRAAVEPPSPAETIPPMGRGFWPFLAALLLFALGNSSDAFILLRLSQVGISAQGIAVLWSLHHLVKMAATYGGGRCADRFGARPLIAAGWLYYAAVYALFACCSSAPSLIAVFLAYGLYYGLTEPAEKALLAKLAPPQRRGRAFGCYHAAIGLTALPASLLFGWLWNRSGAATAFGVGALLALAAALLVSCGKAEEAAHV